MKEDMNNHIDGNKQNNHYRNLEWISNKNNIIHAIKTGLMTFPTGEAAKRFQSSILVYNKDGNHVDTLNGNLDMKNKGYDWRNVNACIYGTRKTHRGMTFKRN